jgi:peptidoglycan/LPS O-acetylase OafA/YrhL
MRFPTIGAHAVHGFFVLSGFLMTFVMQQSYGYTLNGRISFAANRALRLYPSYFFAIVLSAFLILMVGRDIAAEYRFNLGIPFDWWTWLQNITMIYFSPFPQEVTPRLSPATWALTLELLFYAIICLGASRSPRLTWIWLSLSVAYTALTFFAGLGYAYRYDFILSGSLPFSIGALIYHYRGRLTLSVAPKTALIFFVPTFGLLSLTEHFGQAIGSALVKEASFYLNMLLNAVVIAALLPGRPGKLDRLLGDMSYHIYILHWAIAMFISTQFLNIATPERTPLGASAMILTVAATMAISLLMTRLVDHPIENIRRRVRNRNS